MKGKLGFLNSRKESKNELDVKSYHDKKKRQIKRWGNIHNIKSLDKEYTYNKKQGKWMEKQ